MGTEDEKRHLRHARQRRTKARHRANFGQLHHRIDEQREDRNRHKRARKEYRETLDAKRKRYEWELRQEEPNEKRLANLEVEIKRAAHRLDLHRRAEHRLTHAVEGLLRKIHKRHVRLKKLDRKVAVAVRELRRARQQEHQPSSGVGTFDGKPIAAWMIPTMNHARSNGWSGSLTSGYRSPEYSEQLCYQICGAPTCPGRCAGRTSNHTKHVKPEGAVDVSDPYGFDRAQSTLWNALGAADPWHFSTTGR